MYMTLIISMITLIPITCEAINNTRHGAAGSSAMPDRSSGPTLPETLESQI